MSIGVNWLDAAAQVGANATMNGQETALVLFSGGQDLAVRLAYALQNHGRWKRWALTMARRIRLS